MVQVQGLGAAGAGRAKLAGGAGGAGSIGGVLNNPALTVEDKVMMMLMMVMKKADRDIQQQGQRINALQQKGQNAGGQQGQGAPSIDVETMKLKRMIDKRSQMFDSLRQIVDKYNETAKNLIQSIGR